MVRSVSDIGVIAISIACVGTRVGDLIHFLPNLNIKTIRFQLGLLYNALIRHGVPYQ